MEFINGIQWWPLLFLIVGSVAISYFAITLMRKSKSPEHSIELPSPDTKAEASFSNNLGETLLGFLIIGIVIGFVKAAPEFAAEDWMELFKWGLILSGILLFVFAVIHRQKTMMIVLLLALGIVLFAVLKWAVLFVF